MNGVIPRIAASSYSNTAPLVWSFLYGQNHGKVEMILDTAPARSAELLGQDRVDAALVPVIAYQLIEGVRLIPYVCIGAKERVRSVCLVTKGDDLEDVKTVALDISSRTSVALTKIIFREFLGSEPAYHEAEPDVGAMLDEADCALIIGDPALRLSIKTPDSKYRVFDLAEEWHRHTGLGFVFAMWMTGRQKLAVDVGAARDEGVAHIEEIISNYESEIPLGRDDFREYLSRNISYSVSDSMHAGMDLYFELARKHDLIPAIRPIAYID
jgi:chorismate dehydratase